MNRDKVFCEIKNLQTRGVITWYPWIGKDYFYGGMLVVGESNCAKDDVGVTPDVAVSAVNGNPWFTREVINRACILHEAYNRTFSAITYLLRKSDGLNVDNASVETWNSLAYMDVIQCAMKGVGWLGANARKRIERPSPSLWKPGWEALYCVINILKPNKLFFVGASLFYNSKRKYLPAGVNVRIRNEEFINRLWLRTGVITLLDGKKVDVICIPNPGGEQGFVKEAWRSSVQCRLEGIDD